jgi:hypothetical protein
VGQGAAGRGEEGAKTLLDMSLCIPNWSAVAVIGVETATLAFLGFICNL